MRHYLRFKNMCGWVMLNEESSNDGLSKILIITASGREVDL